MIPCPKCGADIDVEEDEIDEGERLICEQCGVHLVVVGTDPLDLEHDTEEEDEDDDFEEEFEEEDEEEEEEEEEEDWH